MPRATSDALLHDCYHRKRNSRHYLVLEGREGNCKRRGRPKRSNIYTVHLLEGDEGRDALERYGFATGKNWDPTSSSEPGKTQFGPIIPIFVNDRFSIFWNFEFY